MDLYQTSERSKRNIWQKDRRKITDWLKKLPKPLALMAADDDLGRDIIAVCKAAGISVPEQVAVLGVDNDQFVCDLCTPSLSSIALNTERAGYETAELLERLMSGQEEMANQQIIVQPTRVVTRHSTDITVIEDPDIARAVNFIMNNSTVNINVNDVTNSVSMSRRNLERRFLAVMGRTVLSEIKRVRVQAIKNMLEETNLKVIKVATMLGFKSTGHLSKYFKRETGMTTKQYRNKFGPK